MNAIQLKNSILQYAMTGKLVNNIEDTGFKKIWDRQVLSNKKVNQILPEEVPFDIPSTWVWARVGDLGVVKTGNTPSTSNIEYYNDKYIPFIKPGDFNEGTLNYDNEYLSEKGAEKARLIEANSILMVCIGGSRGKCAYNDREVACNQQINTLSVNSNLINMQYIFYIMQSHYFQNLMIERATGTATPIVNKTNWSNFIVPVAPLEEQLIIVEKIDELFLKIKECENSYQYLEDLNNRFPIGLEKSVLQYAMQGKLVEQDLKDVPAQNLIEKIQLEKEHLIKEKLIKKEKALTPITEKLIPFNIPNSWEWVRLGDLATITSGSTPLKSNTEYYLDGSIPWITSGETRNSVITVADNFITEKALKECSLKLHPKGTLIMAMYGQGKTRGQVSELGIEATTNQACAAITLYLQDPILKEYVKVCLMSVYNFIREQAAGGAQPNLNLSKIKNILVPLPPLMEQKRIVEKVKKLLNTTMKLVK